MSVHILDVDPTGRIEEKKLCDGGKVETVRFNLMNLRKAKNGDENL